MPSTQTGCSSRITLRAWNSALINWNGAFSSDSLPLPRPPVPPAMISTLPRMLNLLGGLAFEEIRFLEVNVFIAQLGAALPLDTQQQRQADAADHQRAAAVAEEWQGQALGRQQANVHADIDQHLTDPQERQAIGHIGREKLLGLLRPQADVQGAHADEDEQSNGDQCADHAQLFGQYSKHEVGMCFRQVELFLHAVAQTDAEPFTTAEGDQRLAQLVTGTVLISPGVDEVGQTLQAIGLAGHHQHAKAKNAGRQRNKAQQVDPAEEQHGDGRANQYHGGAEVWLGQ